jgi:hypothetical protein
MRWAGNIERIGDRRFAYSVLVGKPEENRSLEITGEDGRIILKYILKNLVGRA